MDLVDAENIVGGRGGWTHGVPEGVRREGWLEMCIWVMGSLRCGCAEGGFWKTVCALTRGNKRVWRWRALSES
jgi:hypothetical protein